MSSAIRPLHTLLIANRGEIARRILRTAQGQGIHCVAVYSEADAQAPFVREADSALCIGPAPARESYLDIARLIAAAKTSGAQAIHPGYGFLSENTEFARQCEAAGLLFIGPPAKAIAAMGSKSAAKALMADAGVPLVPGYHGDAQDDASLIRAAEQIGYPLLIKASAGGGGKGMRVVQASHELADAIATARREAVSAFGDGRLLLERYLLKPRHVEVQLMFDQHGQGVYLFDRDCSVQRRHQKVVEEAPAPNIPAALRQAMGEAAVRCGQAIGYVGAGTVEFLLDTDGQFYFMEMNTRLQVEHPVTECITGLDLVDWQLRVARGEPLPWSQADLKAQGHAMEVRIYAEDPDNDFLPDIGTLKDLFEPHHLPGVRVDSGVEDGQTITPWYDPMLAKVIAYGTSRGQALASLRDALNHYRARGLRLNVGYLQRILHHPAFAEADLTTHFIAHHQAALAQKPFTASGQLALSWLGHFLHVHARGDDPWACADGWRLGDPDVQRCEIELNGTRHALRYRLAGTAQADVWVDEHHHVLTWQAAQARVWLDGQALPLYALGDATALTLFVRGESWTVRINPSDAGAQGQAQEDALVAPMHGRVTAILCHAGDKVAAGTPLLVMEAMKMEHTLRAPADGTVVAVLCDLYQNVPAAQPLIEFEAGGAVVTGE